MVWLQNLSRVNNSDLRAGIFGVLLGLIGCQPNTNLQPDADQGGLTVPDGFGVLVVADSVGRARHLTVRENGDIYVKLQASNPERGSVVALRDSNGDGVADLRQRFGGMTNEGRIYGAGMIIHRGHLYFSSATRIYRFKLNPGELVPEGEPEVVLFDDHEHGEHWHITKPVAFDSEGAMYVPFGSPSNACQDLAATPNGASGGRGLDPCPELIWHGGIWKFPANKTGLRQEDGVRLCSGIRSVVAMRWHPQQKQLFVVMHGRDNLYSLYPDRYDPWQSALLPAEEFLRIDSGANYGWPYCYYDQLQEKKVLAPEYGGDGKIIGRCGDMEIPLMGFPGHWAPNDLHFYQGSQFPARYRDGAFIAFHGSTNRGPYPQAGYFVAFIPFKNGKPDGRWEVFADGFAQVDTIENTRDAKYRPMGLAEGPDGSLYITESNRGKIWRIFYSENPQHFSSDALAKMERHKGLPHIKTPDPINDNLMQNLSQGEQLYQQFCGTCHQRDGQGSPGRYPPLVKTPWVTGPVEKLITLTLAGMSGLIEVSGEKYNAPMPSHHFLPDQDLAEILTFVRKKFGNDGASVKTEEIARVRRELNL